jgi:hypothetical protein
MMPVIYRGAWRCKGLFNLKFLFRKKEFNNNGRWTRNIMVFKSTVIIPALPFL